MIQTLIRAILYAFLVLQPASAGEDIAEAARALAGKAAPHVPATMALHVTSKNLSSLSNGDVARAQAALEKALRRRAPRQAPVAEVRLTASENRREFLLVAEISGEGFRAVEMVRWPRETAVAKALPSIEKRLLWEQETPILDVAVMGEWMLVLDVAKLAVLERREGRWEQASAVALNAPPARDPRGRLEATDQSVSVFLPGETCRGNWRPPATPSCEAAAGEFEVGGERVRFTTARNTLDSDGWPALYSRARAGNGPRALQVVAETDGRARLYDAERRPARVIEEWGSDLAEICGGRVLATRGAADRAQADQVRAYAWADQRAVVATEPLDLPGPVTALWPSGGGAVAVVFNPTSGQYAAYSLSVDCGH